MENINLNNTPSSNIKYIRGLRNIIKFSKNKNLDNNIINKLNSNNNNININNYNNYKIGGANITSPDNQNNSIKKIKNIEEIEIQTNYKKNKTYISNTTPHPIYKKNKKYNLALVKSNIKNIKSLLFSNTKDNFYEYNPYYKEQFDNNIEKYQRKTFSQSFRNISKYNINEEKNNSMPKPMPIKNKIVRNITPKQNMKINTNSIDNINNINNINNIYNNSSYTQRNINKKKLYNFPNINNIYEHKTNLTNVNFDVQNDVIDTTDNNNLNNESKFIKNDLENEIKLKIKENKEIKQNILLLLDEINKIKERQGIVLNYINEKQIKNNERNIKISNIIKKTYNFLNDFYKIINEQNYQIYQKIINNLNLFFN